MKILFLHGWQSTPGGIKPTYLKDHGHEVLNPALPTTTSMPPSASPRPSSTGITRCRRRLRRGGAVAMNIDSAAHAAGAALPGVEAMGNGSNAKALVNPRSAIPPKTPHWQFHLVHTDEPIFARWQPRLSPIGATAILFQLACDGVTPVVRDLPTFRARHACANEDAASYNTDTGRRVASDMRSGLWCVACLVQRGPDRPDSEKVGHHGEETSVKGEGSPLSVNDFSRRSNQPEYKFSREQEVLGQE